LTISQSQKKRIKNIALGILLVIIISTFWFYMHKNHIKIIPRYSGALVAIDQANWKSMWTWLDFGNWYRYSPTGILGVGLIDRYFYAPLFNIEFVADTYSAFGAATRMVPFFIINFIILALLTYVFSLELGLGSEIPFSIGLLFGVNKSFSYFFRFMSTIAASLMMIYIIFALFFWIKYLRTQKKRYLIPYYLFLLLTIGAWEQWLNFLVFLVLYSLITLFSVKEKENKKRILINGIAIPLLLFTIYLCFRIPQALNETSRVGAKAEYVFSYTSELVMLEEIICNASYHISDTIESLLFPWPMLSIRLKEEDNIEISLPDKG